MPTHEDSSSKSNLNVPVSTTSFNMFSQMQTFDHTIDEWSIYEGRIKNLFAINNITKEDMKKSTLLNFIGSSTYKIVYNLCYPEQPNDKTFSELCTILDRHFTPPQVIYQERKIFYNASKHSGETIQSWLVRCRALSANCKFGNRLEAMIVDKFITGLSGKTFDRLCEEEDLDLKRAVDIAQKYECKQQRQQQYQHVKEETFNYVNNNSSSKSFKNGTNNSSNKNASKNNKKVTSSLNHSNCSTASTNQSCKHCGYTTHNSNNCRYKNCKCNKCGKAGHMAQVCRSEKVNCLQTNNKKVKEDKSIQSNDVYNIETHFNYNFNPFRCNHVNAMQPIEVTISINDKKYAFQFDSGASISAISLDFYKQHFSTYKLMTDDTLLLGYGKEKITVAGCIQPIVSFDDIQKKFKILVVKNGGPPILGRNFLYEFNIKSINICNSLNESNHIDAIVKEYSDLFDDTVGKFKNNKVCLEISPDAIPIFCKPRPIPYAFVDKIKQEIKNLESSGIITKVENSKWGTPLVPIMKPDGSIRICADYKITANKFLLDMNYPLPLITDIFVKLGGNCLFSKLDLTKAYNQLELDDKSKEILTWSTPFGLFSMNRLPFGIKPATGIFQKEIEKILIGIPGVISYLDDILIAAPNIKTHIDRLRQVFQTLRKSGLKLNKNKCVFAKPSINYLGHSISKEGLCKLNTHIKAITEAPSPKNTTEVKSFIGLVNYYGKFIKNVSIKLHPLHKLLKKDIPFQWNKNCEKAFNVIKKEIVSEVVLVHFNHDLPITLTCDASNHGVGAVLAHVFPDGTERPIAFASRALNKAEINYAILHKEALAIIFAVQKFFQYLIGNNFTLVTDHKPLLTIFGESKSIPQMTASRLQRWAAILSAFKYKIKYIDSASNKADILSRIPIEEIDNTSEISLSEKTYLNYIGKTDPIPINYKIIKEETKKDNLLSQIIEYLKTNKKISVDKDKIVPFMNKEHELCIENDILMWGHRVVIPTKLRRQILNQVHRSHLGIVKTKSLIRSYFWWPNINKDIETLIKSCKSCLHALASPPRAEIINWEKPDGPWSRIHVDYAGPSHNHYFLIVTDAYSKWIEVFKTKAITAEVTLAMLKQLFTRWGFPKVMVSDNGTQFTSHLVKSFLNNNGVNQIFIPPGHPASNGAAENSVKTFKNILEKVFFENNNISLDEIISNFLLDYRASEHCSTKKSPSMLMLGRQIRLPLDQIRTPILRAESESLSNINKFKKNDLVMIRNYSNPNKKAWKEAIVLNCLGTQWCLCRLESGRQIKRHINQMRRRVEPLIDKYTNISHKYTNNVTNNLLPRNKRNFNQNSEPRSMESIPVQTPAIVSESQTKFHDLRRRSQLRPPNRYGQE